MSGVAGLGPIRFRRLDGSVLLTQEGGGFAFLGEDDFKRLLAGADPAQAPYAALRDGSFLRDRLDFAGLAASWRGLHPGVFQAGPVLHMLVATLRCNQACRYCHSSQVAPERTDTDMSVETARRAVDFIFSTPSPALSIEFQGGEPLLNWPVVKFATRYARLRAKASGRSLSMGVVTNTSLLDDAKLDWLLEHGVSITSSLDGPADLHDANRPFLGGGPSQAEIVKKLARVRERCASKPEWSGLGPSAIMTTTRFSLGRAKDVVDAYAAAGLGQIYLRPLSPVGWAKRAWPQVGYEPKDWLPFYSQGLERCIELTESGRTMVERQALILLVKILGGRDPGFVDLRSPAGTVLGALAYNYDGGIFVSDEGRIASHEGEERFKVGDVAKDGWESVLAHPTTRACVSSSLLENQPLCHQCAYSPYCGVEPVYHYEAQGNMVGRMPESGWCTVLMGVFDEIFRRLRNPRDRKVFESWLAGDQCWQGEKKP